MVFWAKRTLKGQLAKWKFTFDILVTVNMGQNITIHPRISSGAPSVRALELKQSKISGGIKISHSNPISMSLVSFWLELKSF